MAILRLFRSEMLRLMIAGFVVAGVGLTLTQPSQAQDAEQGVAANGLHETARR